MAFVQDILGTHMNLFDHDIRNVDPWCPCCNVCVETSFRALLGCKSMRSSQVISPFSDLCSGVNDCDILSTFVWVEDMLWDEIELFIICLWSNSYCENLFVYGLANASFSLSTLSHYFFDCLLS